MEVWTRLFKHLKAILSNFSIYFLIRLEWRESDLPRIQELMRTYADLPLGFADAAVITLAESVGRVAITDRRHFNVVRTKKALELLP